MKFRKAGNHPGNRKEICMKWRREEYIELMTFGDINRPMFVELFGPLIGLDEEWRRQGAHEDEINMSAFCWDYVPFTGCGGNTNIRGGFEPRLIEDNEDYFIKTDNLGRKMKLCKRFATIPLPLDYPVKNMDDWLKIKHLFEFYEDRIDRTGVEKAINLQNEGVLVTAGIPGGFDLPRELMGEEAVCMAYYDMPELIRDILNTAGETAYRVLEKITRELKIDNLRVHEDMAGKSGSLIGPGIIREFIVPYYRRIWDLVASRGTMLFSQDSDGNMNSVIDVFLDSGVNIMYPMEPAADMDIVAIREKYGKKLALKGGIDKHVLRQGKSSIRKELEYKMGPEMQKGGVVFGLDHRIPNGTPLENYRYYVEIGREILGLPSLEQDMCGWSRMAF